MKERKFSFPPQHDLGAGLDVHKDKINVCLIELSSSRLEHLEYGTDTASLKVLRDWLLSQGVAHVILESTGVYWHTLYDLLSEAGISVLLANAQQVKQMPGRKTDELDSEWLCRLLLHGLARKSFVPPADQQALREYTRRRSHYKRLQSKTKNQMVRILEMCNCKLRSVVSSLGTKSAMDIIRAISQGETDPHLLAGLCRGRARKKAQAMVGHLAGHFQAQHFELLAMLLADHDHQQQQLDQVDRLIEAHIANRHADLQEALTEVSGIGISVAQTILAEAGTNMEVFPSADHFTAWAGAAPGNHQSANKRKAVKIRRGNKYLMIAMIQAAWGAVRTKNSYWRAQFFHLKKRMPAKKAIVAIARKMLKLVYRILKGEIRYVEKGAKAFAQHLRKRKLAQNN